MLIGRQTELAEIRGALANHRLVTLTGPGGVGKTSLARELLSTMDGREGLFADLAPLTGDAVTEAVAGSFRFRSFRDMIESLRKHEAVLVLDNCEHVLDAAAAIASDVLAATDRVSVLATSREPLTAPGEWVLPIRPLDTDGSPSAAEELFAFAAERRGLASALADSDDVRELCRRLDGLPLALEIAATRLVALTPREILQDIEVRLDLLSQRRHRGPQRHQSLAAAIGWSYATLDASHRKHFAELSILPSPFTRDAASAVTDLAHHELVDVLEGLTARSLLMHEADEGISSYRMLETIRTFGAERLGESTPIVESRLHAHALETAGRIADAATRAEPDVMRLLEQSYPIIRWALVRSAKKDRNPFNSAQLVSALWWLEDVGYQSDAAETVESVVARWPDSDQLGPTWGVLSALHRYAGRRDRAHAAAKRAIGYADALGRSYGLRAMGQFARMDGRWEEAKRLFAEGVEAALEAGIEPVALEIEMHLAITEARSGDPHGGIARLESVAQRAGPFELVDAVCRSFLAWLWLSVDVARAAEIARETLTAADRHGYRWGTGSAHMTLGMAAMDENDARSAADHAVRAIEEFQAIRDRTGITLVLLLASAVFAHTGDLEMAAAASAARHEHLSGELGQFERSLYTTIGATIDCSPAAQAVPLARLIRQLEVIAKGEPQIRNRMIVTPELCTFVYAGQQVQLRTNKGLVDLSLLLASPGKEFAALDLMGALVVSGDAGAVLDGEARRQYEARILELQEEIDAATELGDTLSIETHKMELEHLVQELSAAYGLGGRRRHLGVPAERARSAVTHRIKDAIRRVETVHPSLGAHLRNCVKTGRFCVYGPETAAEWDVVTQRASSPGSARVG